MEKDLIEFNPMVGNRVEYLWQEHHAPYFCNIGSIVSQPSMKDGEIRCTVNVSMSDIQDSERLDIDGGRVMLELYDSEGRVLIEHWVPIKEQQITIGIRDPLC